MSNDVQVTYHPSPRWGSASNRNPSPSPFLNSCSVLEIDASEGVDGEKTRPVAGCQLCVDPDAVCALVSAVHADVVCTNAQLDLGLSPGREPRRDHLDRLLEDEADDSRLGIAPSLDGEALQAGGDYVDAALSILGEVFVQVDFVKVAKHGCCG